MLKSLYIENVQSHKNSTLEFVPGVNVIVGPTDSGKTAIIRSLRLLFFNQPKGDDYRSWWGGDTIITGNFNNGILQRIRTSKENVYVLDELTLAALKGDVPKEVSDFLNVSEINFQRQLDPPFLLNKTGGELARFYNKLANLDQIDSGLQTTQKQINLFISEIGSEAIKDKPATGLIKQLNDKIKELENYSHLNKLEIELEVLEEDEKTVNQKGVEINKIKELQTNLSSIESEMIQFTKLIQFEKQINLILQLFKELKLIQNDIDSLYNLSDPIHDTDNEIKKLNKLINQEESANIILELYKSLNESNKKLKELSGFRKELSAIDDSIDFYNSKYNEYHSEFEENFPDVCPLCNK